MSYLVNPFDGFFFDRQTVATTAELLEHGSIVKQWCVDNIGPEGTGWSIACGGIAVEDAGQAATFKLLFG